MAPCCSPKPVQVDPPGEWGQRQPAPSGPGCPGPAGISRRFAPTLTRDLTEMAGRCRLGSAQPCARLQSVHLRRSAAGSGRLGAAQIAHRPACPRHRSAVCPVPLVPGGNRSLSKRRPAPPQPSASGTGACCKSANSRPARAGGKRCSRVSRRPAEPAQGDGQKHPNGCAL